MQGTPTHRQGELRGTNPQTPREVGEERARGRGGAGPHIYTSYFLIILVYPVYIYIYIQIYIYVLDPGSHSLPHSVPMFGGAPVDPGARWAQFIIMRVVGIEGQVGRCFRGHQPTGGGFTGTGKGTQWAQWGRRCSGAGEPIGPWTQTYRLYS